VRLISNTGSDRVLDELKQITEGTSLSVASASFSLFAYASLRESLRALREAQLIVSSDAPAEQLLGEDADRSLRNQLIAKWLARDCLSFLLKIAKIAELSQSLFQSVLVLRDANNQPTTALSGDCSFTTAGLGITPKAVFSLIQVAESALEASALDRWFTQTWSQLSTTVPKGLLANALATIAADAPAFELYPRMLMHLLSGGDELLDEDQIINAATGIRETAVWQRLYRFQRDAVIGAIDKIERFGGCIIADSVGLGKTFEGLAVIKYYELRNQRVLVLCPKRLRDNWTMYRANDRRNILSADRFHYDVLNHTDLSREGGQSGDIDLSYVNWGNYDLVVIDESHNFRNRNAHREHDTRYDHLMKRVIQSGVKTRVLMLSATPVNNRLADLKNQIAFLTEGQDDALQAQGIESIEATVRRAQAQFNSWLKLDEADRTPTRLMDMIGFDYFKLLDLLTIARSRKHIQKYYGTAESGTFPTRRAPTNIKADVDLEHQFPAIRDINDEIRQLNLSAYALMRYVLPAKKSLYEKRYATSIRGGESTFRQADREESLIHLLRINMLKRMESSVVSFGLTVERQLAAVDDLLDHLVRHEETTAEDLSAEDIAVDDAALEAMTVGRKIKVLLTDVDRIRWTQELNEDRQRLSDLLEEAERITPERDAKLQELKQLIVAKCQAPFNAGNRKMLVFTAFADTADYLYRELAAWAQATLGIHSALVTGTGHNRSTIPNMRADFSGILTAFSPRSKERPDDLAAEGEIDLLIATDCISEGQNLQDCDTVVNYDIHWNPVRIIQRFGRIDRLGSRNDAIQLVNFWPNMELEEYIGLEQRVTGRMVLLDVSATGEEDLIRQQSRDAMNDLEYRRKQLLRLQNAVLDLEDLSSGVSIADLTLNDFRRDLAAFQKEHSSVLAQQHLGIFAPVFAEDQELPPGVIFCLQAAGKAALNAIEPGYPLAPYYLVYVAQDGRIVLPYTQARQTLDRLKRACSESTTSPAVQAAAWTAFHRQTGSGEHMELYQGLLAKAIAHVTGKREERAIASLFSPGGTYAQRGEFAGMADYEVMTFLVVLPRE
jgi:hypothetical protein